MTPEFWKPLVAAYQVPHAARATWQLVNSVGAYLLLWCLMAWTVQISWWLTMPLAILAGAILVRVFIIFHDCGHGSFFASSRANNFWGVVTGVLVFTAYAQWRGEHAIHHGTSGNLDRRGVGDVWTMTVAEYRAASFWRKAAYRIVRNPIVLLMIAPLVMFLIENRVPNSNGNVRERRSVWLTTLSLVLLGTLGSFVFGFWAYLIIQLTAIHVAGTIGVWLFYSQHQFEGAYWKRSEDWDFTEAAIRGSAFLELPRVLQWFTGNIGFHHIHHLNARIPNYNLQACHESHPMFRQVASLTLFRSLRTFSLKLWDEASGRLVCFRQARRLYA